MNVKKALAGVVLVVAMLVGSATTAAAAVTASTCIAGGGFVISKPNGTRECYGGMYDGAEVF